jgi:competence protein ComGD
LLGGLTINKEHGFTLLELIIVLSIISLIFLISIPISTNIIRKSNLTLATANTAQLLSLARSQAIALDQDSIITIENNSLHIKTGNINNQHPISRSINTSINRPKLGFKGCGNTKYAGSVKLSNKKQEKKVSLGIGYGKVNVYE